VRVHQKTRKAAVRKAAAYTKGRFAAQERIRTIGHLPTFDDSGQLPSERQLYFDSVEKLEV
jgi:hypothetical protein